MFYSQNDQRVKWLKLGSSGLLVKDFGCTSMCVVNALNDAGHDVKPEDFVRKMNANGGYTGNGLLIWSKASQLYPAFKMDVPGGRYTFVIGQWARYLHWVNIMPGGRVYDPFYGMPVRPLGFKDSYTRTASVMQAANPVPPKTVGTRRIRVTADILNVRTIPTTKDNAPVADKQLSRGDVLDVYVTEVRGTDGNIWLKTVNSNLFIWKGGVQFI